MELINRRRTVAAIVAFVAAAIALVVAAPLVLGRLDMSPNRFEARFVTYLDAYSVEARAYADADADSPDRVLAEGSRRDRFFGDDIERLELRFEKAPLLVGADLRVDGEAAAPVWRWDGFEPLGAALDTVVVTVSADISPGEIAISLNGRALELDRIAGSRAYFDYPDGDDAVLSVRSLEVHPPERRLGGPPVEAVHVLEADPQSVYIGAVSLLREITPLSYIHALHRWDRAAIRDAFEASAGAEVVANEAGFLALRPHDVELTVAYVGDWGEVAASNRARAFPVSVGIRGALAGSALAVFAAVYFAVGRLLWLLAGGRERARAVWAAIDRFAARKRSMTLTGGDLLLAVTLAALAVGGYSGAGPVLSIPAASLAFVAVLVLSRERGREGPEESILSLPALRMHRQPLGWVAVAVLAALTASLHLYRIGEPYLWLDEVYSFLPARYIAERGAPVYETGYTYDRAYPYHWTVAQFMRVLGPSTYAARLPNVLFNLGTLVVVYLFGRRRSVAAGLLAAALWASTSYVLIFTRWVRMYPMVWFLFALAAYLFYRAVIDMARPVLRLRVRGLDLSFNPLLFAAFLAVVLLSASVHRLSVTLLWAVALFYLMEMVVCRERGRAIAAFAVAVVAIVAVGYSTYGTVNVLEAYFERPSPGWTRAGGRSFSVVWDRVIAHIPLAFLYPAAIGASFAERNRTLRFVTAVAAAGILFVGHQYAQLPRYWSMTIPFIVLATVLSLVEIVTRFRSHRRLVALALLLALVAPAVASNTARFVRELGEVNRTYDGDALRPRTKRDYGPILDYLELFSADVSDTMTPMHPSYTLYAHGQRVTGVYHDDYEHRVGIETFGSAELLERLSGRPLVYYRDVDSSLAAHEQWFAARLARHPRIADGVNLWVPLRRE